MKPLLVDIKNATVRREVFENTVEVFDQLNLQVAQGENVAIIGANGSGKSSLLGLLQGDLHPIVKPDSYVKILGQTAINIWEYRRKIGIVSHNLQREYRDDVLGSDVILSGFYASIGVWEHQVYSDEQRQQVTVIAKQLGIEHLMQRYFCQLSTGEKRRFILARALIHQPNTLVFDEPSSGLDIVARQHYLAIIEKLMSDGKQMIIVTHHINEIPEGIQRVIMMKDNKIMDDGDKQQMLTSKKLSQLFGVELTVSNHSKSGRYVIEII